jgi:hypothetical protein
VTPEEKSSDEHEQSIQENRSGSGSNRHRPTTKRSKVQAKQPLLQSYISRTQSFDAVWADGIRFPSQVPPHTLILGSHPSIQSLSQSQYYAHPMKYVK